jgi:RNA polymerase sigma factor (sigma-70 family)
MTHRHDEPRNSESIVQVARLVELSSLGTVGARQLRDRTSSASRDRALVQAYFSATAEGREWWDASRRNADALYDAAQALADGDLGVRKISVRLMNLAAALGHDGARAIVSGNGERRPTGNCPACLSSAPGEPEGKAGQVGLQSQHHGRPDSGAGMDWRSFEQFFVNFLDPLTVTLSAETSLRAEDCRAVLLQAMKAAFDNWEDISAAGRPEEWVLGYAVRRQRQRHDPAVRLICIVIYDACSRSDSSSQHHGDSGADLVPCRDIDARITGAMVTAVQSKVRPGDSLPSRVAQYALECQQYLTSRCAGDFPGPSRSLADLEEAVTGFYTRHFWSAVHLATLLVGEPEQAEEIAVAAFNTAHRAWRQGNKPLDEAATVLRQSVINQARAANRYRKAQALGQEKKKPRPEQHRGDEGQPEYRPVVLAALQRLTIRQREAVALRYYADLEITQIADVMGVSAPAANTHMASGAWEFQSILGYPCPLPDPSPPGPDAGLERPQARFRDGSHSS